MEVGEKEGKRFRKHPVTNMSSLTQSHLIDCPLLLCNLGGFEFYKKTAPQISGRSVILGQQNLNGGVREHT